MITVTTKAASKFREIAKEEGYEGKPVRVRVKGGGCAGFTYDMYFDEDPVGDLDEEIVVEGVTFRVDPLSLQYIDTTEIDYVDGLNGAGFKFNNPNVKTSCGCGHSFDA